MRIGGSFASNMVYGNENLGCFIFLGYLSMNWRSIVQEVLAVMGDLTIAFRFRDRSVIRDRFADFIRSKIESVLYRRVIQLLVYSVGSRIFPLFMSFNLPVKSPCGLFFL